MDAKMLSYLTGQRDPKTLVSLPGQIPSTGLSLMYCEACLRSLAFPEMNYRRQDTQRAYAKTCGWITRHQSYTTWLEDGVGILWIKGKLGSWKSTLMEFLLRDFEKQALYQESIQLSFFLHSRGTILQKSRLGMYRSLLY